MATGTSFIADMQRWNKLSKDQLVALARQACQQLAYKVQNNTGPPVGPNIITGFLIGSWQPSIGSLSAKGGVSTENPNKDTDAELAVIVSTLSLGETFYYVNNAAYAMRQEYGFTGVDSLGRMVHQRGKFFVRKTISQWPSIVADVASDLNFRI